MQGVWQFWIRTRMFNATTVIGLFFGVLLESLYQNGIGKVSRWHLLNPATIISDIDRNLKGPKKGTCKKKNAATFTCLTAIICTLFFYETSSQLLLKAGVFQFLTIVSPAIPPYMCQQYYHLPSPIRAGRREGKWSLSPLQLMFKNTAFLVRDLTESCHSS